MLGADPVKVDRIRAFCPKDDMVQGISEDREETYTLKLRDRIQQAVAFHGRPLVTTDRRTQTVSSPDSSNVDTPELSDNNLHMLLALLT
jgi:hypothetical protein